MSNDFRPPSGKELLVLGLLVSHREMYGLEMVNAASDQLARGTIYVLLGRMEDKGLVVSRQIKTEGASGLPKRVYALTGLGQRTYRAWQHAREAFGTGEAIVGGVA